MKRFIGYFLAAIVASAAQASTSPAPPLDIPASQDVRTLTPARQLEDLAELLATSRQDAADLLKQLNATKDEAEKKRVQSDLDKVNAQIDDLVLSIEKVAVGSLDWGSLAEQQSQSFDWKSELEDIFRPIVVELKQMTERPRRIERLRSEKAFYEERLPIAERALEKIAALHKDATLPSLKKDLARVEERWRNRRNDLQNKLNVTALELEQLLAPKEDAAGSGWEAAKEFLTGRGLSILLALSAFGFTLFVLRTVHRVYERKVSRNAKRRKIFASRLVNFLFTTLSLVISLIVAMSVLSVRGDWLLLGLLILVLVATVLALRQSVPRYVKEARLLLNIGAVREDERVIYNGLPWRVANLSVYTTLVNPLLRGGRLRLSLDELATLISRPMADNEAWFPTRENDFVLLDDKTFGRVLAQTPEYVDLAVAGSIQTYPVETFLGKNPRNLSKEGFGILVELGLDYRYQSDITTRIRDELEGYVREKLQQHPFAADLKELTVEFNEAAASSLNIAIIGAFTGDAAPNYFGIRRLLNKLAVDACNHFSWSIPFNQISVHMETPVNVQPAAALPR